MTDETRIVAGLLGTASLFYLLIKLTQYNSSLRKWIRVKRNPWVKVGYVSEIFLHPVKSCRGLSLDWSWCGEWGLQHNEMIDRHFMIWDSNERKKVTPTTIPKTVLIQPSVKDGMLMLDYNAADDGENHAEFSLELMLKDALVQHVDMWKSDISGYDCGDAVSQWLCTKLQAAPLSLRLLHYSTRLNHLNGRGLDVSMKTHKPAVHAVLQALGRKDKVAFSNGTPYELGTEESLQDLNNRLENPLTFRSFRPNFVIKGTSKAFDEDNWDEIRIGSEARFSNILASSRCPTTTVDPDTGAKNHNSEPLKTLRKYRLAADSERQVYKYAPLFCIKLGIDAAGKVNVGDPVYVRYK